MGRTAGTYRETVRLNFKAAERPDPTEEEGNPSTPEKEEVEVPVGDEALLEQIQEGSEELYNDELGSEVPRDERVQEPATPSDLLGVDFGQLPLFNSTIN